MAKSAEWIVSQFEYLRSKHSRKHQEMSSIEQTYTGGIKVALPELNEYERPAVANLLKIGIKGHAQRVASVVPMIVAPPLRPGFKNSEEKAHQRHQAVDGWRRMNNETAKRRRRALYLTAYGSSPITIAPVSPEDDRHFPFLRVRNPLTTYQAPTHDTDNIEPEYAIFADKRSRAWLIERYPGAMGSLRKGRDQSFTVLEYVDAYETTLVVMGASDNAKPTRGFGDPAPIDGGAPYMPLMSVPNRTGICPLVYPGVIDLDGCVSRYADLIGNFQQSAKLNALLMIATQRDIFSDEWLVPMPNVAGTPEVVEQADGLMGVVGVVKGGRIERMNAVANQSAQMALDSLEREGRLNGGVPAAWGGESSSNVRTARRGADLLESATAAQIQEDQEVFERSDEAQFRRQIAVMKVYYGTAPSMFFIPRDGKIIHDDYVPDDAFETDQVFSRYPMTGMDLAQMTTEIGQMIGDGTLSAETGMELDPRIKDVPEERRRIYLEGLRRAMLQQTEAQPMDPHKLALIALELAKPGQTLEGAFDVVEKDLRAEQAATEQGQPTADGTPAGEATQPGLSQSPEAEALAKQTALGQTSGVAGTATVNPPNTGATDVMKLLAAAHPAAPAPANA